MTGGWYDISSGDRQFFKFKDPGDELSGKWEGTAPNKYNGLNGIIVDKDGVRNEFTLSKKLEDLLAMEIGTRLRIVFLRKRLLKDGNSFKEFHIQGWDPKREGSSPVPEFDKPVEPSSSDGEDEVPF